MLVEENSLSLCKYLSRAACCCLLLFLLCLWLSPCRCSAQGRTSPLTFLFSLPFSASVSCKISKCKTSFSCPDSQSMILNWDLITFLLLLQAEFAPNSDSPKRHSKALNSPCPILYQWAWGLSTGRDGLITQVCAEGWDSLIT